MLLLRPSPIPLSISHALYNIHASAPLTIYPHLFRTFILGKLCLEANTDLVDEFKHAGAVFSLLRLRGRVVVAVENEQTVKQPAIAAVVVGFSIGVRERCTLLDVAAREKIAMRLDVCRPDDLVKVSWRVLQWKKVIVSSDRISSMP